MEQIRIFLISKMSLSVITVKLFLNVLAKINNMEAKAENFYFAHECTFLRQSDRNSDILKLF